MITAAVGALALLVLSAVLNWPVGDSDEPGSAPAPQQVFEAPAGTCLNWTEPDAADIRQVTCGEPHLFEVTGRTDLSAELGDRARFPDEAQWQRLKRERCGEVSEQFLRGRLDPKGRFAVGAFTPNEQGWSSGDRTMHCGLQQPAPSGQLHRTTGSAARVDQANVYPTGRCLGINGTSVWDSTDCARPHAVEVTGVVDLGQQFPEGFPPEPAQDEFLSGRCAEITGQYAGDPAAARDKGLTTYWDTLGQQGWDAGSRRVNCKVSAQLPDGSGLAPVTGSVTGEVRVSPDPAPTRPESDEHRVPADGDR